MRIAVIGTIGSGKSEVLKVAREMGLATLSADEINRELLLEKEYIALLEKEFPFAVREGKVDRAALAKAVFCDGEARARLNALAHPRILSRIERAKDDPLVVEVPLFAGSGAKRLFDKTLLVVCPDGLKKERLLSRGMTAEDIEARIAAQGEERYLAGDVTILNDGTIEELREKAAEAFEYLLKDS